MQLAVVTMTEGELYKQSAKRTEVRTKNIEAAKAVADAVRTSLGPRGMDKMVVQPDNEVIITNDGATILNKMTVQQPAAKMLVELSKSQDMVAGDGTTTVVVICGALLKKSLGLLGMGVHPTLISDSFQISCDRACQILTEVAQPVDINDRAALIQAAETSLSSKVVSQYSSIFAPLAVDAIFKVLDKDQPNSVDLRDIKVINKLGSLIDDSVLVEGMMFDQKASYIAGGITKVENAKIGLIQFCISPPKTDMENNVIVSDYQQMDKILREERNYILQIIKKIRAVGCNVLLIQKSILRDAVTDLSLHYLAKAKIMVVKDIERDDIEFISKTLNCLPITHVDHMKPEKLAHAELVQEVDMGSGKVVNVTGIQNPGKTATILLRGANKLMVEEAERSLHDALCVIRCLVQQPYLLPGGSAPEMEVTHKLSAWSQTVKGMESYCARDFAEALEIIPYTLAENAGLNPIQIVSQLRNLHAKGGQNEGINVKRGTVTDMLQEKVVQPLLVSKSAIQLATECVRMILKIDDIVPTR
eukprot:TRINITY_DN964_c0_g2_i1.p1 TRINITY_DN964_c0_g2~~TRINITY_DN964_c0_g2_i1.p1  ORF type:complete len:531 (-),score=70.64 TRINITY_DN964_c0_g2_i1:230-1822(-)